MADGSARGTVERLEPSKAQRAAARKVAESKATIPHLYVQGTLEIGAARTARSPRSSHAVGARASRRAAPQRQPTGTAPSRPTRASTSASSPTTPTASWCRRSSTPTRRTEAEIAAEWEALAAKALNGSITAREVAGGTFTVASGFGYEGCAYLPVINAGQAANLGIGSPRDGVIGATVAADARMISGTEAARFMALIQAELQKANGTRVTMAAEGNGTGEMQSRIIDVPIESLPFIDEHYIEIAAKPDEVWDALIRVVSGMGESRKGAPDLEGARLRGDRDRGRGRRDRLEDPGLRRHPLGQAGRARADGPAPLLAVRADLHRSSRSPAASCS